MKVRILFTGRGYPLARELPPELELPEGSDLQAALEALAAQEVGDSVPGADHTKHDRDLGPLPATCLVAVSGEHLGTVANYTNRQLRDGDEIVLLAPVAGG